MSTDIDAKLKEAEQGALRLKRIDAMLDSLMAEKQELEKKKYYLEGELKRNSWMSISWRIVGYWDFLHRAW